MYFLLKCKKTSHSDVGASLREAIQAELGEREANSAACSEACRTLSRLRLGAGQGSVVDPQELQTRRAYLRAVSFLSDSASIPSLLCAPHPTKLTWSDAFNPREKMTCADLLLDRISVRWNVAAGICDNALLAFRDAIGPADTQVALNGASKAFQMTAGLFDLLVKESPFEFGDGNSLTKDLTRTALIALQNTFLGNAQLASYFYSVESTLTPRGVCAKVVAGARDFYVRALRNAKSPELKDTAISKQLGTHVAVLIELCEAESQFQAEMSLGEPEEVMPERLARARESVAALERANTLVREMDSGDDAVSALVDGVAKRDAIIRARAAEVARQNSYIYHAPELPSVHPVTGRQMNFAPSWKDDGESAEKAILDLPGALAQSAAEAEARAAEKVKQAEEERERKSREAEEEARATAALEAERRARELEAEALEQERLAKEREGRAREAAAREQERQALERQLRERQAAEAAEAAARERQLEAQRASDLEAKEREEAALKRRNEEEYGNLAQATVAARKDELRLAREALLRDIATAERALDREESSSVTVSRVIAPSRVTARPEGVSEEDAYSTVRTAVESDGLKRLMDLLEQVKGLSSTADLKLEEIRRVLAKEAADDLIVGQKAAAFGIMHQESSVLTKGMYERLDKISASVKQAHNADRTIEMSIEKHRAKLEPLAELNLTGIQPGAAARATAREEQMRLLLSAKTRLYDSLRNDLSKARQLVQDEASLSRDFDLLLAGDDPHVAMSNRSTNMPMHDIVHARYGDICLNVTTFAKQASSAQELLQRGLANVKNAAPATQPRPVDPMEIVWKHYVGARKHTDLCKYLNEGLKFYVGEDDSISVLLTESTDYAIARASQAEIMDASISSRHTPSSSPAGQPLSPPQQYVSMYAPSDPRNHNPPSFPCQNDENQHWSVASGQQPHTDHALVHQSQQNTQHPPPPPTAPPYDPSSYQSDFSQPMSRASSDPPAQQPGRFNILEYRARQQAVPANPVLGPLQGLPVPGPPPGSDPPGVVFPVRPCDDYGNPSRGQQSPPRHGFVEDQPPPPPPGTFCQSQPPLPQQPPPPTQRPPPAQQPQPPSQQPPPPPSQVRGPVGFFGRHRQ